MGHSGGCQSTGGSICGTSDRPWDTGTHKKRRAKDDVQATLKERTVKMTEGPRMKQQNKGLRHKMAATSVEGVDIGRIFRKTTELEIKKQIVRSSTGLQEMSDWTL
jgi:hypothetical protein